MTQYDAKCSIRILIHRYYGRTYKQPEKQFAATRAESVPRGRRKERTLAHSELVHDAASRSRLYPTCHLSASELQQDGLADPRRVPQLGRQLQSSIQVATVECFLRAPARGASANLGHYSSDQITQQKGAARIAGRTATTRILLQVIEAEHGPQRSSVLCNLDTPQLVLLLWPHSRLSVAEALQGPARQCHEIL